MDFVDVRFTRQQCAEIALCVAMCAMNGSLSHVNALTIVAAIQDAMIIPKEGLNQ